MLSGEWVAADIQTVAGRVQLNHRGAAAALAEVSRSFFFFFFSFTGKKTNIVNPG